MEIACNEKGTFVIQGLIFSLEGKKDLQKLFVELILPEANNIIKKKYGSYILKAAYKTFEPSQLEGLTQSFKEEFVKNICDENAICILKEIALKLSGDTDKLNQLFSLFIGHFNELKSNTCYHYGLQYFIEVSHSII